MIDLIHQQGFCTRNNRWNFQRNHSKLYQEVEDHIKEKRTTAVNQLYDAFASSQKNTLDKYGDLVIVNIPFIEKVGGGSARCMIAEIF